MIPQPGQRIENIPDAELWAVRRHLKRKLVYYIRERARDQWLTAGTHPVQIIASGVLLDPYFADHRLCPPLCHL